MYMINLDDPVHDNLCLTARKDNLAWLWHRRIGHASYNVLHKLVKYEMVKGLPEFFFKKNKIFYESCTQRKQTRKSFKSEQKIYLQNLLNSYIWIYLVLQGQ